MYVLQEHVDGVDSHGRMFHRLLEVGGDDVHSCAVELDLCITDCHLPAWRQECQWHLKVPG